MVEVCSWLGCCKEKQTLPQHFLPLLQALGYGCAVVPSSGPISVPFILITMALHLLALSVPWLMGVCVGPVHRCENLCLAGEVLPFQFLSLLCPVTNRSHYYLYCTRPSATFRPLKWSIPRPEDQEVTYKCESASWPWVKHRGGVKPAQTTI